MLSFSRQNQSILNKEMKPKSGCTLHEGHGWKGIGMSYTVGKLRKRPSDWAVSIINSCYGLWQELKEIFNDEKSAILNTPPMQNFIVESTIINFWIWLVQPWNGCLSHKARANVESCLYLPEGWICLNQAWALVGLVIVYQLIHEVVLTALSNEPSDV